MRRRRWGGGGGGGGRVGTGGSGRGGVQAVLQTTQVLWLLLPPLRLDGGFEDVYPDLRATRGAP